MIKLKDFLETLSSFQKINLHEKVVSAKDGWINTFPLAFYETTDVVKKLGDDHLNAEVISVSPCPYEGIAVLTKRYTD